MVLDTLDRFLARRTGLAPHYLILHSLVVGLHAREVFEFGVGESTHVLFDALQETGGHLTSCSPEPPKDHSLSLRMPWPSWRFLCFPSDQALRQLDMDEAFDLVLHDGSHSAAVVAQDLSSILPRVRQWGLVLVHDTLHSYVGAEVRLGVELALTHAAIQAVRFKTFTLPFAFGLTLLQRISPHPTAGTVQYSLRDKPSSPHQTESPKHYG